MRNSHLTYMPKDAGRGGGGLVKGEDEKVRERKRRGVDVMNFF